MARFQPYDTRNWFWEHIHRPYTYRVEFIGTWLSLMGYLALSLGLLRRYGRWLADNFSESSALRLRWLRWLLVLLGIVNAQWLLEIVLREFFGLYYRYDYSTELLGGMLFIIGIVGLRQADRPAVRATEDELTADAVAMAYAPPPAAPGHAEMPESAAPPLPPPPPSRVAPAVDAAVAERIRRALADDRLYLNPTLTLAELAAHTGLAPKLISFTINAGLGQSFNDLVNGLRVAEVQRRLAAPDAQRYTLLGIALESGFNSKTTFNRVFKQLTGVAPREFPAG